MLDSSTASYSNLAWRKDSADLAALKSKTDDTHDGPTYLALAWTHLGEPSEAAHVYDPTADPKFPAGLRTVTYPSPFVVGGRRHDLPRVVRLVSEAACAET